MHVATLSKVIAEWAKASEQLAVELSLFDPGIYFSDEIGKWRGPTWSSRAVYTKFRNQT